MKSFQRESASRTPAVYPQAVNLRVIDSPQRAPSWLDRNPQAILWLFPLMLGGPIVALSMIVLILVG